MVLQTKNSIVFILLCCLLMFSCNKDNGVSTINIDADLLPSIHAEGITTFVSDSGITRYKLETEIWDMYTQANDPYWYFPEGIYLERFDSLFQVEFSLKADTAYFYEARELWHLIGNIFIQNLEGESFETEELFWDSKKPATSIDAVYTDKQVRITQPERIVVSQGLRSNSAMNNYQLFNMESELYVKEEKLQKDTEATDSIAKTNVIQPIDSITE
ncbi:LPS export ABC transporter periplasmic protein LptC [Bacteroidales bacterium OttesenSCG-928-M11]|nr:LPS export ABC transporter periplasmic protein LptC [Bacteroidales bacterium OttesenSCG-928-M11]